MRLLGVIAIAAVLLSGCLSDENKDASGANLPQGPIAPVVAPPPANIKDSKDVMAGVDPFNVVDNAICSQDVSTCFEYPFKITADQLANGSKVKAKAALTWGLPASDFDLYLLKSGETAAVATSAEAPPATSEAFSHNIAKEGDYKVVVVAWAVAQDTYELNVEFSKA